MNIVSKHSYQIREKNDRKDHLDIICVIGMGPVGIRFIREMVTRNPDSKIISFGDEPWEPYNRVKLSTLLDGESKIVDISNALDKRAYSKVVQHHNCSVVSINRENNTIKDTTGRVHRYGKLILAVGSTPNVPYIKGIYLDGIYTFRDLNDTQNLVARQTRSRVTIVVGGGLLGLEAAKAMQKNNTQVYIIDHSIRLLFNQLDDYGGNLLFEHVLSLGIRVRLSTGIKSIEGEHAVESITLTNGQKIACDTLIFATGIRANTQLALNCGLNIGRGIKVNDLMQTNDPDIYAIGECCEHRGKVYGIVKPGLEQAGIAANHIATNKPIPYVGSIAATQLKVFDYSVFSMGIVGEQENSINHKFLIYLSVNQCIYRKLVLQNGRLVGAIAMGKWNQVNRLREAIGKKRRVLPWQKAKFLRTGTLWNKPDVLAVNQWPADK